jgi:hypothetical protein
MEKDEEIKLDQEIKELVCDTWEYELKDIEGRKIVIGIAIMDMKVCLVITVPYQNNERHY